MVFSGALNWSIDRVVYRRLRNSPRLAPLIAAIGISFILQGIGIYWKGSNTVLPPALIPTDVRSINILTDWFGLETQAALPRARSRRHPAHSTAPHRIVMARLPHAHR